MNFIVSNYLSDYLHTLTSVDNYKKLMPILSYSDYFNNQTFIGGVKLYQVDNVPPNMIANIKNILHGKLPDPAIYMDS